MAKNVTLNLTGIVLTLVLAGALLAAYALGTAGRSDASPTSASSTSSPTRTIVMDGQGSATGVPDELMFTVAVSVTRSDVSPAMDESSRTMKTVLGALKDFGVAGKDIRTTGLSINPVYDYSGSTERLTGYSVNQRARVTVRDLARAGKAMAAAASAGGNAVRINSVSLDIADRAALLEQARNAAVADATAKARQYAEASGQQLGEVTSLKEVSAPAPATAETGAVLGGLADSAYRSAAAVPVKAGQQNLDVRIQVVWALS